MEQFREGLLLELRRLVGIHEAEVESVLQADATKAKEARTEQSRGSSAFNDKDKEDERNAVRRVTRDLDGKSTVVCSQRLVNALPVTLSRRCASLVRQVDLWLSRFVTNLSMSTSAHLLAAQCHWWAVRKNSSGLRCAGYLWVVTNKSERDALLLRLGRRFNLQRLT